MAGDWIKMRSGLQHDPKVFAIADYLANCPDFCNWLSFDQYSHAVTCDAALRHCVTGALHAVWCAANEHAVDGAISGASETWCDSISGVPNFGAAMCHVGWLVVESGSIVFPKFNCHNTSGAERQKRYRERHQRKHRNKSDVTSNVTRAVTSNAREEKSREEKSNKNTPFPHSLCSAGFAAAWDDWKRHRTEIKKPLKPTMEAAQLKEFAEWGEDRAIAAIRFTIRMGWQGIREPEQSGSANQRSQQSTSSIPF